MLHPTGGIVQTVVSVQLTSLGGTLHPKSERTPGAPFPVVPVTITPTLPPEALLENSASVLLARQSVSGTNTRLTTDSAMGNWMTIVTEGFEGEFPPPDGRWIVQDLSNDGYERYWDNHSYSSHSGGWAAWPANGGADGIEPVSGADDYPNNMNTRMIYGPFDLSDAVAAATEFYHWRETENPYDYFTFEVSHDGVAFEELARYSGSLQSWTLSSVEYDEYAGDDSVWVAWRFFSDSSISKHGVWIDDIAIQKLIPGNVTVQGSLHHYNRGDQYIPTGYTKVYLYDDDGAPGSDSDDDLLGITVADAQGGFQFASRTNWDEDDETAALANRSLDIYVIWETSDPFSGQRVTNFNDFPYRFMSSTQSDVADTVAEFNYQIPNDSDGEPAVWIFQDMYRGWEYIHNTTGDDPGDAVTRWEVNGTGLLPCSGSCFWPGPSVNGAFIGDSNVDSPDIVIHELGHHYMYNAMGNWWWPEVGDMLTCLEHNLNEPENPLCAWTEGWADFLPLLVNGDTCFDWDNSSCGLNGLNLETPTWGAPNWSDGDIVEGRVAGALYDLFDTTDDGLDHASFGFAPIWGIVGDAAAEYAFTEFWSKWKARAYNRHFAVHAIYQNTVDYNTPPLMLLPDCKMLEGYAVKANALNLDAYTFDQESNGQELKWSIVAISDWRCQNVGINAQNYIDIPVPHLGVSNSCDVTVRVTDGILTVDDTFNIQVAPVADRVNLPFVARNQ